MNPYSIIFSNSFQSCLIIAFGSEYAWNAALDFGGYNIPFATLVAIAASSLALILNYGLGYYAAALREQWFYLSEATYQRISLSYRRYFAVLLLVPSLPFLPFVTVFSLLAGIFRVPPKLALCLIVLGRVLYYGCCLLQHAHQHS